MNAKVRTFLALPLAEYFSESISELIGRLKPYSQGVKWISPDLLHVTLHFFGDTDSSELHAIKSLVEQITDHETPLDISLGGVGAFPNEKDPWILWTRIEHDAARLVRLQQNLEAAFREEGFFCESREFQPHATLARLKRNASSFHFPEKPIEFKTEESRIDRLVLFQSVLRPQGPVYEPLEIFRLNPAA